MARMYSIYADIDGLRDEERGFVTVDFNAAIDWLAGHVPQLSEQRLRALIDEETHSLHM